MFPGVAAGRQVLRKMLRNRCDTVTQGRLRVVPVAALNKIPSISSKTGLASSGLSPGRTVITNSGRIARAEVRSDITSRGLLQALRTALLTGVAAFAGTTLYFAASPGMAFAQTAGGSGGAGFDGMGGFGGSGGSGFTGSAGSVGGPNNTAGGGGGGGAAGGGSGGSGGAASPAAGGAGGPAGAAGGIGGNVALVAGGGGGGGGGGNNGNGAGTATIANTGTLAGEAGGAGGTGGATGFGGGRGGGGGGGGAGGYGAVVTGSGASSNSSIISGGAGGAGGTGGAGGGGGNGGDGGVGVQFTTTGATFTNSGTVTGGNGGTAGAGGNAQFPGANGNAGMGGAAIIGAGLAIINNGTITGGLSGDNVTRADAIVFTGGINFLGGTGTVGSFTMTSGGTFAPGNGTPGTSMTVSGNLAFQSGAIYLVQVNPATSSFANVTGTATLGGATVNAVFANGNFISKQYTILTATGGVSGTFNPAVVSNNPNLSGTLSYSANDVFLNEKLVFAVPGGLNQNQQAVGNALTNFFNTTGGIPVTFGALTSAGLTQASGELATGSQQTTFDAMGLFMGLMTDPFMNRGAGANATPGAAGYAQEGDGASAYAGSQRTDAFAMFTKAPPAPFEQHWSVWSGGFGGSQSTEGNATTGSNNTTSNVYGTAVGADYLFSPNTIAGFALAGGGTNFSVNGSGSGHSDLFQAGAYIRHTEGAAYVAAALAYGWQDITTNRTVSIAGSDMLRAEFNANAYSGRVEGGYRFVAPWTGGVGITPYAAAQFTTFDLPSYAESALSGSSAFALAYGAKDVTDTRSELGIRTDKSFLVPDGILTLRTRFAWAHDYDPDRSIAATFQSLPGASFVVNGAAQASDSALTTASIEMKWKNGWSAAATFEGEFSDVTSSYAGKGVVRYQW